MRLLVVDKPDAAACFLLKKSFCPVQAEMVSFNSI